MDTYGAQSLDTRLMARITYTSPIAVACWADVIDPKYNDEYRTTKYGVGIVVTNDQALPLLEKVAEVMDAEAARNPRFDMANARIPVSPSMSTPEGGGDKVEDPDHKLITFSTNGLTKTGATAPPPTLWDSRGIVIPPGTVTEIPYGSEIVVVADVFLYDKGKGSQGVALGLQGVQIVRLAERVQAPPAVEGIEGGFVVGGPGPATARAAAAAPASTQPHDTQPAAPAKPPSALDLLRRA